MPHVSVIIPAYNQAQYLGDAIQSVLDQSYNDYEIIVIDDGSTDSTPAVAAQFSEQIRYIRQENQGLAGARNTGIRAARGKLIGLLDSDDQWLPTFLETMVSLAEAHPQAAVYYCDAQCMDADGNTLPQTLGASTTPVDTPEAMYQTLLRANFIIPSATVLRQSVIAGVGLFDQQLRSCEDWDLWLRILPDYEFIGSPEHLLRYRIHGSSLSTNVDGMQYAVRAVIEKHFGPDDENYANWPTEKRRAYGGVYRYHALTFVQRQNNWTAAAPWLQKALRADPTIAVDLPLFYDLVLGAQTSENSSSISAAELKERAAQINAMLAEIFANPVDASLRSLRRQTYGTAHYALGLAAYNTGQRSLARQFLWQALRFRPELNRDVLVMGNLAKSFLPRAILDRLKRHNPLIPSP